MNVASAWIAIGIAVLSLLSTPGPLLAQDAPATTPPPTHEALRAALARYAKEPSIGDVLRAARSANQSSTNAELRQRARLSGLVPVIGLKARRGQAVDLASSAADDGLRLSTDDDLTLEAAMTFHLARTVFASEEVSLAREARAERLDASKRTAEIIRLYFERRRLQLERDLLSAEAAAQDKTVEPSAQPSTQTGPSGAPPAAQPAAAASSPEAADLARIMRIAEIEAQLDVFTGGAFHRMMQR